MTLHLLIAAVVAAAPPGKPAAAPGVGAKAKMATLELASAGEVEPGVARAMTEAIVAEVDARGYFEALSSTELQALLGVERQKQLLGCADDSCITELAGALGAPYLMTGSLTRLGNVYQLNIQVIETAKQRPVGRSTKVARDFEGLRAIIPYAVAEACGTPLPPPPSRVLPYTLIAGGAAALVAGGVLGIVALNNESVVRGELKADDMSIAARLGTAQSYNDRLAAVSLQKTVSLVALCAGAVLTVLGIWLVPPDAPQTGVKVALGLSGTGVAVVGAW